MKFYSAISITLHIHLGVNVKDSAYNYFKSIYTDELHITAVSPLRKFSGHVSIKRRTFCIVIDQINVLTMLYFLRRD